MDPVMRPVLTLLCFLRAFEAARVLVVLTAPARSISHLYEPLVAGLGSRGHNVTYITPFSLEQPLASVNEILLPDFYQTYIERPGVKTMFDVRKSFWSFPLAYFTQMNIKLCEAALREDGVQRLLKSDQEFDLLVAAAQMQEGMVAGLAHRFQVPVVGLSYIMANPWANFMIGNPTPLSFIPGPMVNYSDHMTFLQRILNTVTSMCVELYNHFYHLPLQEASMKKVFGDDLPPLVDIIRNTSLVLVNHHHALAFPRPYVPNMIEIGGYHVKQLEELPKDLMKYLDESKDGVILFSLGSHIKSSQMPLEKREALLEGFSRLKEDVLWKFEDGSMMNISKNIRVEKWLPQSDILAHPNLKLFVTHGGLLSTTETILRGVPVVGVPIMGDQHVNMKYVEDIGVGRTLQFDDLTADSVYNTINLVLSDPKYRENAKLRSQLLSDNPRPPLESALYWIEYVMRHKGAPHLRVAAQDLYWFQLYLLDVIAVLALAGTSIMAVQIYFIRKLLKWLFQKTATKENKIKLKDK